MAAWFQDIDIWLGQILLPSYAARLIFWALLIAVIHTFLYSRFSPQVRIQELQKQIREQFIVMVSHEGSFEAYGGIVRSYLGTCLAELRALFFPVIISVLPVLMLYLALEDRYAWQWPAPGQWVQIETVPENAVLKTSYPSQIRRRGDAYEVGWPKQDDIPVWEDSSGRLLVQQPFRHGVVKLQKRKGISFLWEGDLPHLSDHTDLESVRFCLPKQEGIPWGPSWLRIWWIPFWTVFLMVNLILRKLWRLV